jgi:anti-sigma regulatory factor (Ser/Thr protein kinase)
MVGRDPERDGDGVRRTHDGYRHEAFFWSGDDQFLAGTVPFVTQGLAAGQPVMVAVVPPHIDLLRGALGGAADQVEFFDMLQLGANPARIIPAWERFVDAHAGQPTRGIGEPIWHGRRVAELVECQMHEALLNMAVDTQTPLWLMCPYDLGSLPEEVVAEAHRSHPVVVDIETHRGSTTYGGAHHVATMFETDLQEVDVAVSHRVFGDGDLAAVRADVRACATSVGLSQERSDDLALAVHEVALNSALHGRGASELRIWEADDALVCEVRGHGLIADPMTGRRLPPWQEQHGRGLWIANQLCDLVQVRSGVAGTTVRIHTWL